MNRVFKSIAIALLVSTVFGIGGWFVANSRYTEAELVMRVPIASYMKHASEWAKSRDDFGLFVQTQVDLIRSTYVLEKAVRHPALSNLSIVKSQERPDRWLASALEFENAKNSEIIILRLRLRADDETAVLILNEIANVYIRDVVNTVDSRTLANKKKLTTELKTVQDSLANDRRERDGLVPMLRRREARTLVAETKVLDLMLQIKRESNPDRRLEMHDEIERVEQIAFGSESEFSAEIEAAKFDKKIAAAEAKEATLLSELERIDNVIAEGPGIRILQKALVTSQKRDSGSR